MGGLLGLAALTNLLGGASTGANQGMEQVREENLKRDAMAQQEKLGSFDIDALRSVLPPGIIPEGVTGRMPNAMAPTIGSVAEKNIALQAARAKNENVGRALDQAAIDHGAPLREGNATDLNANPEAAGATPPTTPDKDMQTIAAMARAGEADKAVTAFTNLLRGRQLDAKGVGHVVQGQDAEGNDIVTVVPTNRQGNVSGPTQVVQGVKPVFNKNPVVLATQAYMQDPSEQNLAKLVAAAKQVPVAPGGSVQNQVNLIPGLPPVKGQGAAPSVPVLSRPPYIPAGEDEKLGMRNYVVSKLDEVAKQAKTMPQLNSFQGRAGLAIRGYLAGHTPIDSLSPEEQKWVTMHENLRTQLINVETGLGAFRSPKMMALYEQIIGRYWSPETPARLQALADMVREQGNAVADVQGAQGKTQIRPQARPADADAVSAPRESPAARFMRERQGKR
jgi:hypothetical protein